MIHLHIGLWNQADGCAGESLVAATETESETEDDPPEQDSETCKHLDSLNLLAHLSGNIIVSASFGTI